MFAVFLDQRRDGAATARSASRMRPARHDDADVESAGAFMLWFQPALLGDVLIRQHGFDACGFAQSSQGVSYVDAPEEALGARSGPGGGVR